MGRTVWTAALALALGGCATGPLQENPVLLSPERVAAQPNPVYLPLGPFSYAKVYEKVTDVVQDYFEIEKFTPFDGIIDTYPRIAPGLGQPWKPGSPDLYQRLLASFQTIRYRAQVQIRAANDGGYFVSVKVFRELEDLERPTREYERRGAAVFRNEVSVERQYEVVDETRLDAAWIPIGQDHQLEQVILDRIARLDLNCVNNFAPPKCP
jgi:hypothetical protein